MNLLISSYSFGAHRGSEAGVGWNVARGLALRGHQVTVLTTSEFAGMNRAALEQEQLAIRIIEKDFGITQFNSSWSYHRWQKKIVTTIQEETRSHQYDLIHHITFNQYRGICDVFAADLPYIIGPIGGAELIPRPLLRYGNLSFGKRLKELARYFSYDAQPLVRNCRAHKSKGKILVSNRPTALRLAQFSQPSEICPAIAIHEHEINSSLSRQTHTDPYILFDGGLVRSQKGTWLALRALRQLWQTGTHIPLRIVGIQPSDNARVTQYAKKLGLPAESLQLLPRVSREAMLQFMQNATIMLSATYRDSGSMALLEALSKGCKIVCLDIPSQEWLPDEFARKVPICPSSREMELAIANTLREEISAPPHSPEWHQKRVQWLTRNMTWNVRLDAFEEHYRAIL